MLTLGLASGCNPTDPNSQKTGDADQNPNAADADHDGYSLEEGDCDDADNRVSPGEIEVCDGLDNDCSGGVDDGVTKTVYDDADGDGFGNPDAAHAVCAAAEGQVDNGNDCDDADDAVFGGAVEVCDGIDNNCDGQIDEGVTSTYYADADADGFGDADAPTDACAPTADLVENDADCDDSNALASPAGDEICDEIDNNCDGNVDEGVKQTWWVDLDGDGFGSTALSEEACAQPTGYAADDHDCDDANEDVNPDADEWCDGIDDDCDGNIDEADATGSSVWYADYDADGHGDGTVSLSACDAPAGYIASSDDCDDSLATVFPGAAEYCNGIDDDCDRSTDEADAVDIAMWYLDFDGDTYGGTRFTFTSCDAPAGYVSSSDDCDDSDDTIHPDATDTCNEIDDNCDGNVDEGLTLSTWYADDDADGYGDPSVTTDDCTMPAGYVADADDCDDAEATTYPGATELCNGVDDDCDSSVDEGLLGSAATCPAEDCAEILAADPSAVDGTYYLDPGSYYCDMTTDGGGWTRVKDNLTVYGTGYDATYYNSEGFSWTETLFKYDSGSVQAHCTYPGSLTGCNNLGFQFGSENWGVALNWGSSICGMSTSDYTGATTYIGGYDFVISRALSTSTIRLGTLEGISSCTIGDNPGTAYTDVLVRQ